MRIGPVLMLVSLAALGLMAAAGALPRGAHEGPRADPLGFPGSWRDARGTNVATAGVDGFWAPHWRAENGTMLSLAGYSYVEPSSAIDRALATGSAPVHVRVVVDDEVGDLRQLGVVERPGRASDVRVLHQWRATGTLGTRVVETIVPAGSAGSGWLFLSGGLHVRAIELTLPA